jgi:hypothetical protein
MEPVSLGVIVAALLAKALDRAEDGALDEGAGALRRLIGVVRQHFSDAGDEQGELTLARVADAPDSERRVRLLAELLDARTTEDLAFRNELEGLVEQARSAGVDVGSVSQVAIGRQNVQVAGLNNSSVTVTGFPAPEATGRPAPPTD